MSTEISIPFFNPGQLLRSTDLNNLISGLDYQDRMTRVYLHGMGILSGLNLSVIEQGNGKCCLLVEEGFGISSDGFLMKFEGGIFKNVTDFRIRKGWLDIKAKATNGTPSIENIRNPFSRNNGPEIILNELTLSTNGAENLSAFLEKKLPKDGQSINLKVALLWHAKKEKEFNSIHVCSQDDENLITDLKLVLIDDEITFEEDLNNPTNFKTTHLSISRIGFSENGIDLCLNKQNYQAHIIGLCLPIFEKFKTCLNEEALTSYKDLMEEHLGEKVGGVNTFLESLKDVFTLYLENNGELPNVYWRYWHQYFYAYTQDLIIAFNEFLDAVCKVQTANACPDLFKFPACLVLGTMEVSKSETGLICKTTNNCRTNYIPSYLDAENQKVIKEARFLALRWLKMLQSFRFHLNIGKEGLVFNDVGIDVIKITGSKGRNYPLGERPIPIYFNVSNNIKELLDCWNYDFTKKNQTDRIRAYSIQIEPENHPLFTNLDAISFFGIEGHLGQPLGASYQRILELRNQYNLPFDIRCVRLDNDFSENDANLEDILNQISGRRVNFYNDDLQKNYHQIRTAFLCQLRHFGGISQEIIESLKELLVEDVKQFNATSFLETLNANRNNNGEDPHLLEAAIENLIKEMEEGKKYGHFLNIPLFSTFAMRHPGLEHLGGVPKGGTFVLVYCEVGINPANVKEYKIVADFSLPYYCCDSFPKNNIIVTPDTNTPDTNTPDTNTPDTNTPDTNTPDTNTPDTNTPDTNTLKNANLKEVANQDEIPRKTGKGNIPTKPKKRTTKSLRKLLQNRHERQYKNMEAIGKADKVLKTRNAFKHSTRQMLVVDPTPEVLRSEFSNVTRSYFLILDRAGGPNDTNVIQAMANFFAYCLDRILLNNSNELSNADQEILKTLFKKIKARPQFDWSDLKKIWNEKELKTIVDAPIIEILKNFFTESKNS